MSYLSSTLQACPNIQAELSTLFRSKNFGLFQEPLPFLEFITGPENTAGVSIAPAVNPGKGKVRTIEARYSQRFLDSEVAENATTTCSATKTAGDSVEEYAIDIEENVQEARKVVLADLSDSCRENPDYFNELYLKMIDAVERKLATVHAEAASALTGKWASNVSGVNAGNQLVVKTLKDSSVDLYPQTMQKIESAAMKTGYYGRKVIFSGDTLYDYYNALKTGCCSTSGVDLAKQLEQYGIAVVYDRRIASAFGNDNNAVLTQPGALALLHWTQNNWKEGMEQTPFARGSSFFSTVVFGIRTGIPMDLKVVESCEGDVIITVTATTKLVGLPTDLFEIGDHMQNVNFFNQIKVTNV